MELNDNLIIDFDAIMDFVTKQDNTRTSNSEITEIYGQGEDTSEITLINKQLREVKNNGDNSIFSLRYDLIKCFINILNGMMVEDPEDITFLEKIAFNSLVNKGIIKEINTNE